MKLNPAQQIAAKRTLEVLESITAGLPLTVAFDEAERAVGRPITQTDRDYLEALMEREGWIVHRVDRFTGRIIHNITPSGSGTLAVL